MKILRGEITEENGRDLCPIALTEESCCIRVYAVSTVGGHPCQIDTSLMTLTTPDSSSQSTRNFVVKGCSKLRQTNLATPGVRCAEYWKVPFFEETVYGLGNRSQKLTRDEVDS